MRGVVPTASMQVKPVLPSSPVTSAEATCAFRPVVVTTPQRIGAPECANATPHLSIRTQRLLWGYIFVYQLLNAVLLSCLAAMYGTATSRDSVLYFLRYYFLFSEAQQFIMRVHPYVCAGYALLASVFAHGALTMLWHSVTRRRLCYARAPVATPQAKRVVPATITTTTTSRRLRRVTAALRWLVRVAKSLLRTYLSFGLRGQYFSVGFFVREVIESALQTTQALASSRKLSNVFVNQAYGVLIFLNCFTCVALPRLYKSKTTVTAATGRFVCVLADLALDFAWGSIIPLVVFWPYLLMYRAHSRGITIDIPVENVQREVEFILVMSTWDFTLSAFPFMSSAANMSTIRRILRSFDDTRCATGAAPVSAVTSIAAVVPTATTTTTTTSPGPQSGHTTRHLACVDRGSVSTRTRTLCERVCHALFLLYGIVILIISIAAGTTSRMNSSHSHSDVPIASFTCLHRVHPWLSTKEACVGRVIDCAAANIVGAHDELANVLQQFDESTLANIAFVQCSQLEIPAEIHRFAHLSTLTIRYSDVHAWPLDAAVTDAYFRELQTIRIRHSIFSSIPAGFVDVPLPRSVEWLSLGNVNIAAVADRIGTNWQHLKYFYCTACSFTTFPAVLVNSMHELLEVLLTNNSIAAIDDTDVAHMAPLSNLWLDGTSLATLPDAVWHQCSTLWDLSLERTNISSIPLWVDGIAASTLRVLAFSTPLCDNPIEVDQHSFVQCFADPS